jgi:hypothetical protein
MIQEPVRFLNAIADQMISEIPGKKRTELDMGFVFDDLSVLSTADVDLINSPRNSGFVKPKPLFLVSQFVARKKFVAILIGCCTRYGS